MNLRAVGWLLGCVVLLLGAFLLVPAAVALLYAEVEALDAFLKATGIAAVIGIALVRWNRGSILTPEGRPDYFRREGLAVVGLAWIVCGAVGALPYILAGTCRSPVDAFFEAVSGFTTTGSTILDGESISRMPHAIAFWRSFTHWLGGFGIVMVFVVLFPTGGRSLFRSEIPGVSREASTQRVRDSAVGLLRIYLGMSALEWLLLLSTGISSFDAVIHTFGTIATGGFSNHPESVAYFLSWKAEIVIALFMFAAGLNFGVYDLWVRRGWRKAWARLRTSDEIKLYAGMIALSTLAIAVVLWLWGGGEGRPDSNLPDYRHFPRALLDSLFQVVSIQTSTGYGTADFDRWPQFCRVLLMFLAVVGACAGSTGGGLKTIRFVIVCRAALTGVRRFIRPRGVFHVRVDGETLDEATVASVSGYFTLWILVFLGGLLFLSAFGIELETSATAVVATLNNIGPGLAAVGPIMHFGELPNAVKGLLSIYMILGRLEFYAVVALFVPGFWRR